MTLAERLLAARGGELFRGVLADRLEHREARLRGDALALSQQALVDERADAVEDVTRLVRAARCLDRLEARAADEHAEAREEHPVGLVEEVVAPADGAAQRLLAGRQVLRAAGQQREAGLEPGEDCRRAQPR